MGTDVTYFKETGIIDKHKEMKRIVTNRSTSRLLARSSVNMTMGIYLGWSEEVVSRLDRLTNNCEI